LSSAGSEFDRPRIVPGASGLKQELLHDFGSCLEPPPALLAAGFARHESIQRRLSDIRQK
jgi:hypothetical protein